jgi:glycosyltransferase involved in cell wall biosynthesis
MSKSRFSVIVTCYRQGKYICNMLPGLLTDLSTQDEVIIVDDGSDDGSVELLQREIAGVSRITLLTGPPSGSAAKARNRGLRAATGEWVSFLDGDDAYAAGRHALMAEGIASFPDADVIFSRNYWVLDPESPHKTVFPDGILQSDLADISHWHNDRWAEVDSSKLLKLSLTKVPPMHPLGMVFRRKWLTQRALEFDPRFPVAEDRDFILRALAGAKAIYLAEATGYYYVRGSGLDSRRDPEAVFARLLQHYTTLAPGFVQPSGLEEAAVWVKVAAAEETFAEVLSAHQYIGSALRYSLRSFVTKPSVRTAKQAVALALKRVFRSRPSGVEK